MCPDVVRVSPDGGELARCCAALPAGRRILLGIAGAPGAGKSTLAGAVVELLGTQAVRVPMDGFHRYDADLRERGLLDRKGAPETFDVTSYVQVLRRIAAADSELRAPAFDRTTEEPTEDGIRVPADVQVVVTEGNYLLLDAAPWQAVRETLDVVWFVQVEPGLRRSRLTARHVEFGKSPAQARAWVERVDEANSALVDATRDRADLIVDLTAWEQRSQGLDAP